MVKDLEPGARAVLGDLQLAGDHRRLQPRAGPVCAVESTTHHKNTDPSPLALAPCDLCHDQPSPRDTGRGEHRLLFNPQGKIRPDQPPPLRGVTHLKKKPVGQKVGYRSWTNQRKSCTMCHAIVWLSKATELCAPSDGNGRWDVEHSKGERPKSAKTRHRGDAHGFLRIS